MFLYVSFCMFCKIHYYTGKMFYVSLMVTIRQKPTVNSQKIKRRDSKPTTMENHQFTQEGSKKGRKKPRKRQKSQKQ